MIAATAMLRAIPAALVVLCLTGLWPRSIHAVDLRDVLTDYTITSWSRKDGVVGPVWALAQDADGFLWTGTDAGLQRFDGVRFVSWENLGGASLPQLTVRALRVASDQSIWVGFGAGGGIARISGRSVRVFAEADGAFTGAVTTIVEDDDRSIWVAGTGGLHRFANGRWQRLGAEHGLPNVGATTVFIDSSRRLWVSTSAGLFVRRDPSVDRFEQADDPADPVRPLSISQDRSGRIWTTDYIVGFRAVGQRVTPRRDQYGRGYRILHDRQGNRWIGTIGQGLWRLASRPEDEPETFERATVLSGLSSDAVRSIIEDRDGNIWVGTTEGIDRLVPHRVTPWTGLGLVSSLSAAPGPSLLVGTEDEIIHFGLQRGVWRPDPERVAAPGMQSVRGGVGGRTWVSTIEGLHRLEQRRLVHVPFPPGVRPAPIEALAADPRGGVWVIAGDGLVLRDEGNGLSLFARVEAVRDTSVIAAIADSRHRIWMLMTRSRVGVLSENAQFRVFGTADGLTPEVHSTLNEGRDGSIWIAGGSDVMQLREDKFVSVGRSNGLPGGILALTEDDQRNLWLATAAGIVRLPIDEFTAGAANPSYRMRMRVFDTSDGLAGYPVVGDRQAVRAGDGTLWFVTSRGLSMLNPQSLSAVRQASRVTLDEILADDRPATANRLPAGTAKVQFAYTAPELTYPFKARFRYRLDGFDTNWIDAGNRRQAVYTNLPPRKYTFRVAVSTDESAWSELQAPWPFELAPRFYQTWWFYPAARALDGRTHRCRLATATAATAPAVLARAG